MREKRTQATRMFTNSQKRPVNVRNSNVISQKSCGRNPASGNDNIREVSKADNVNLLSVTSGHSIPIHNRFDMFNNTVLFPENTCTSVTCDQKVVCLHSEKQDEQSNVH